jgi:hypothetical protein
MLPLATTAAHPSTHKLKNLNLHMPVHMAFQWLVYEPWDGVEVVVLRLMSASEISALS